MSETICMPDFWELNSLIAHIDYKDIRICVMDYVAFKTKALIDFGYDSLSESHVLNSTWRCYSGQTIETDIIDQFIKQEIFVQV